MAEQAGIVRTGANVTIVAAATSTTIYTVDTARNTQVATPTAAGVPAFIIRRLWLYSGQPAAVLVTLGETVAAAWTQRLPDIDLLPGVLQVMGEGTLMPIIAYRFSSSLIGRSSAAGAGVLGIQIMAEVVVYPDHLIRG